MRLKKIKLAGFKSFVDPTTVDLVSDRVAIVGPNGCGKSNVIDAVRWVMGESSAKQLRGESMADVIFSGSTARAPIGQASVELVFDNSDGSLGGEYAAFTEIAIKRVVTRDGQSNYFLNNARCRRKDITDIFLGTGLGPRSYAIIEQGMISRLIEAKPDDLRIFLEEAAGISKYKERRRETENRIEHTQENLARLSDLRGEIGKQLVKLEKQAEAAEKYKTLKKDLRKVSAEHLALKWRTFDLEMATTHRDLASHEIKVDKQIADMRQLDAQIEAQRVAYDDNQEIWQKNQSAYYQAAAQVSKFEQSLANQQERKEQIEMDLAALSESFTDLQRTLTEDQHEHARMQTELEALKPQAQEFKMQFDSSHQALYSAEESMQKWQKNWEMVNQQMAQVNQHAYVAQEKMNHLQDNIDVASERLALMQENHLILVSTDLTNTLQAMQGECEQSATQLINAKQAVSDLQGEIHTQQNQNEQVQQQVDNTREALQTLESEVVSIKALQQAAFDQQQDAAKNWLKEQSLTDKQRLVQQLVVEPDWVCAVETVLGHYLQAICVDKLEDFAERLTEFTQGSVVLFENNGQATEMPYHAKALINKIKTPLLIAHLVQDIYFAHTLAEALQMRAQLAPHESVVTQQGIWLSKQWLRVKRSVDQQAGVLAREQRLQELQPQLIQLQTTLQSLQQQILLGKDQVKSLNEQLSQAQQQLNQAAHRDTDLQAQHRALIVRQEELLTQREKVSKEIQEIEQRLATHKEFLHQANQTHQEAQVSVAKFSQDKLQLEAKRQEITLDLETAKNKANQDQNFNNQLTLQLSGLMHRLELTKNQLQRSEQQIEKLRMREVQLKQAHSAAYEPIAQLAAELEEAIDAQARNENEMQTARAQLDQTAHQLRTSEQSRLQIEEALQAMRSELEEYRLAEQSIRIKRDAINDQLTELEFVVAEVLQELPESAQINEWDQKEERLNSQIKRLGAINLAAIDEFSEHQQRLQYLDQQNDDLLSALNTLQQAMEKIDQETKQRFKETFDTVNSNLGHLFSQVFGGGHACLELTENDLLNTGITIMAQPPGKRNSTIHALSGGEKALTALSLVFSMFRLNPAPFCMLDEVDAPLDDANVNRFARMVKEMSEHIQFIFITHNKGTMEIAEHLIGVTMKEAGVSRLVSVDVEKAVELAVA